LQREGLSFDARSGVHPRHFEKIWHVLSVVDFIEESFLVRIHVHACYEEIFRVNGHLRTFLPRYVECAVPLPLGRDSRTAVTCAQWPAVSGRQAADAVVFIGAVGAVRIATRRPRR